MHPIQTNSLTRHFEPRHLRRRPWHIIRPPRDVARAERPTVAVDSLTFAVDHGECYGLLGPNGAGKTTTTRLLSTLLEPTSGEARVCGFDVVRAGRNVRRSVGVAFAGERGLYWRLTGRENLELFGRLQYLPGELIRRRTRALLAFLGLADRADELVETYSTGMKQRLNLARILLHDPPVLLLDEPTASLDPVAARSARDLIRDLRDRGKTILLTTHNMQEAEQLCDRVGILHRGRLAAEDPPEVLIRKAGLDPRLELRLAGDAEAARETLRDLALWWGTPTDDGQVDVALRAPRGWRTAHTVTERLDRVGVTVASSRLRDATLEDAFIKLTGSRLEGPFEHV